MVLNVALVNAFIMSENRYPPFLRRISSFGFGASIRGIRVQRYETFLIYLL